jgi:branched-chain amino acid transport system substrate-binding protein
MGPVGNNTLHTWQYAAEIRRPRELGARRALSRLFAFDNKLSPQESLNDLKSAIDQDIHYVVQGNGTSVARALIGGISKHNERNPGKEVVFLNYAAVDPDLTNGECTFWHFRWDANSDMKMEGLTNFIAKQKDVHRVYLINQDYAFGHQVQRAAREYLAKQAPGHRDRRRRPASAGQGDRLFAVRRQDEGGQCRHGHHRQLGVPICPC